MSLLINQILQEYDVIKHFSTNIKIYESPFPIKEITNLEDLRFWAKEEKGHKLFTFDEIAKAMPRRKPMASLTVELLNEFQVLRKYKLSILATTITERQADNAILDPAIIDGYFIKPNWANPKVVDYADYLEPLMDGFKDIPTTSIKYDTWDSAPFTKHGKQKRPQFSDKEESDLWDLTHGVSAKELGLHSQQVARLWRKKIKEVLEREHHKSP